MGSSKPKQKRYGTIAANKVVVEGITFDSELEASVYRNLRYFFPSAVILCHESLLICDESPGFDSLSWRIDFIVHMNNKTAYVEAKGVIEPHLRLLLRMVEHYLPHVFDRLVLVGSSAKIGRKIRVVPIETAIDCLRAYFAQ